MLRATLEFLACMAGHPFFFFFFLLKDSVGDSCWNSIHCSKQMPLSHLLSFLSELEFPICPEVGPQVTDPVSVYWERGERK